MLKLPQEFQDCLAVCYGKLGASHMPKIYRREIKGSMQTLNT